MYAFYCKIGQCAELAKPENFYSDSPGVSTHLLTCCEETKDSRGMIWNKTCLSYEKNNGTCPKETSG